MTSARKKPEHKPEKQEKDRNVDRESEQSFPASDPPSYSGGTIGAPDRKTPHKHSK